MSGLTVRSSTVSLASFSVQPAAKTSFAVAATTSIATKASISNIFAKVTDSVSTKLALNRFDFRLVLDPIFIRPRDTRYNDELPRSTSKFTPFEELSGIATTRPEIISVSEFKPLFEANRTGMTAAGEFLDAQVKLMNLKHEAAVTLINDLKKDKAMAEQLDQIEGDFLLHVKNLKSNADFLGSLQRYIERLSKLFDLRDSGTQVDAATLLGQYYSSVYNNITSAKATLPTFTYADLLSQHGFGKNNVLGFSSTKIYLQTLFEARKILRAGNDALISVDPSIAMKDVDASALNRRSYKDPHVSLGSVSGFPTLADVVANRIHESDAKLTSYLQQLESGFRGVDNTFSGASSEEIAYSLKLRTLAREASYSKTLADPAVTTLLASYGYPISATAGNQQLFDAVFGQLGSRITDDRSSANGNSMSAIASQVVGDSAVLTYEVDYLEDDQGSVFTPGAAFYVASTVRPSDNGFSVERAASLVTRLSSVVDKYIDFVGKFNILPKVGNVLLSQDAGSQAAYDASLMANNLYGLFVEPASGLLKNDVDGNPIVDMLAEAATHPQLRANLHVYMCCVTNVAGDGLVDAAAARSNAGVDLRQDAQNAAAAAENNNARVSPTVDKVIKNIVYYYKQITGNSSGATKVEYALKNFGEQGPLARFIAYVFALHGIYVRSTDGGSTRYSHLTNNAMIALTVQSVLDTARRYAYSPVRLNAATQLNTNHAALSVVAAAFKPTVQSAVATTVSASATVKALGRVTAAPAVSVSVKATTARALLTKNPLKQAVVARLNREDELCVRTVLAPLNAVRVVRDGLKDYVIYLQRAESVKAINDILTVVGDRKLVELLGDRGQVQLLCNTVDSVLARINPLSDANASTTDGVDVAALTRSAGDPAEDLKVFDDSFITSKTANVLKSVFASAKYDLARGSNIRVVAFGLPHGFGARMKNKFKLTTFAEQSKSKQKQTDVVVADVYKVDVRYPDLVFKPIPRVFELSRFPVRDENTFLRISPNASLDTALESVNTKDYSSFEATRTDSTKRALDGNVEYAFMSAADRRSMLRNHVMSYMLELYFRLLTGIPLSERELYVEDPDADDRPASFVVRAVLGKQTEKIFKVPVPPPPPPPPYVPPTGKFANLTVTAATAKDNVFLSIFANIDDAAKQNAKKKAAADAAAAAAAELNRKKTVYVDRAVAGKYMMSPKIFERIFFVDVDPDDFEIDREETFKSDAGKATFAQLQQAGEVVVTTERVSNEQRDSFKLKDHRTEKQMVFEKYFVVVRSYSPLTTRST